MKNFKFYQAACITAFFAVGMVTGACAQASRTASHSAATSTDANKVVLKVGSTQVTRSDIDSLLSSLSPQEQQQVERQGRQSVGEQYATMLVLSHAAVSQHLDSSPLFEKALKQAKDRLLAQLEYQTLVSKAVVTLTEINQFYSTHTTEFEEAQVREVAVLKKGQGAQGSSPGFSPEEARTRADSIRKALASGQDPQRVAHQFSVPNQVIVETEPRTIQNTPSLPEFAKVAFQLKDGQVSPLQDTSNAVIFFQVVKHPKLTLQDATPEIENALRQQKVAAAVAGLKKSTPIWMDHAYFGTQSTSGPANTQP